MSRNKLIRLVHESTGKSYAQCRAICKCGHWNESDVLAYICAIEPTAREMVETIKLVMAGVFDALADVSARCSESFSNLAESLKGA